MVVKIAHRGASAYAPENTLKSFEKALELKADCIEFDVHLTKDKEIIVMHDKSVARTTDGRGLIENLTLSEIKKFHESNDESVPTLQGVLDLLKNKCSCRIELKDDNMANRVVEIIKDNSMENDVILLSAEEKVLKKIFGIKKEFLVERKESIDKIIKKAKSAKAFSVALPYKNATKELINEIHKNKLNINVWNVNDKKDIEKLKKMGVDAITSNYPDKI